MIESDQDPLDGYRGFEALDDETQELLGVLAKTDIDDQTLLQSLDDASEVSKFLMSAPGKVLRMALKTAETEMLLYASSDKPIRDIVKIAMEYRIKSTSLGLLLQTVRDAEEAKDNRENELVQDLESVDYQETDAASLF